jgi:hypothetical protein|tara:strand:- start:412 stop:582 length:171 start_codon:yes stop_codon:yes gene_type:complete
MQITPKVLLVMIFWMIVVTSVIFSINAFLDIPDEIIGPAFFLSIGMTISSTMNYYK